MRLLLVQVFFLSEMQLFLLGGLKLALFNFSTDIQFLFVLKYLSVSSVH